MKKTVKPYTIGTGNEAIMYLVPYQNYNPTSTAPTEIGSCLKA
ncbi:hypothetical protein ABIC22_004012 [Paenibacillus sp. PvP094]